MENMRRHGFNTIRAWLVWGVMEPFPGRIDFDYLVSFLDLAESHALKAILLFHLHGCPEWACRKHKPYWYVDPRGRSFEPSQRANTPSGGWPGLCPDHAEVRQLEADFIEPVVQQFGNHPAVTSWEPINEPHVWIDLAEDPPTPYCWCDATRAAFLGWLKARYGQLDVLELAWGRRFGDWENVRPPTWRYGFSDWVDWRTFHAENLASHVARRVQLIKRHTASPVIAHAWGGGCVVCPHLGAMSFDDWKNAEVVDKWGYSAFPMAAGQLQMVGLGTDAARGAAQGREFWQSELGSGDYGSGLQRQGRLRPEIQTMFCWESIRHGAKGLLFWQYRKESHGSEFGAFGLTDYGGKETPLLQAMARVGAVLQEHAELFAKAAVPPASVAILFSYRSFMTDWAQNRHNQLSVDCLSGYYRIFWDNNVPVDIVHEERITLDQLQRYKLLVLPMPVALTHGIRRLLMDYVRAGGTILSDPYVCAFNGDLSLATEVPGGSLAEVFGCGEDDISCPARKPVELRLLGESYTVTGSHFRAVWKPSAKSDVLGFYADGGGAAVVANKFGRGCGMISGLNLGLAASSGESISDDLQRKQHADGDNAAARAVMALALRAGVRPDIRTPAGVRASLLESQDGSALLIAINTLDVHTTGEIQLGRFRMRLAKDLLGNKTLSNLTLKFQPYESKVLVVLPDE